MTGNYPPTQGRDAAWRLVFDPALDPSDLARIAAAYPEFAAIVAAHPRLTPELASWLAHMGRPEVNAALAARGYGPVAPMGPETRRGKRPRKGRIVALVCASVALVMAAAGTYWFVTRHGNSAAALTEAPDIMSEPEFGGTVILRDVFDREFAKCDFAGFFDEDTGLAYGGNDEAPLVLAGFDLTTGDPKWQLDLAGLFGFVHEDNWNTIETLFDGGLAAVQVQGTGEAQSVAVLNPSGESAGTLKSGFGLMGFHDGVLVVLDNDDGEAAFVGYSASDLSAPLWEAHSDWVVLDPDRDETWEGGQPVDLYNEATGAWWILSDDGYVDSKTGQLVGFGKDVIRQGAKVNYEMADGPSVVVLRTVGDKTVRVDPKTGDEMWDQSIDTDGGRRHFAISGRTLVVTFSVEDEDEDDVLMAVDARSGDVLWDEDLPCVRPAPHLVDGLAVLECGDLSVLDLASGDKIAEVSGVGSVSAYGRKVAYAISPGYGEVVAFDLTDGLRELWWVDTVKGGFGWEDGHYDKSEVDSWTPVFSMEHTRTRLFVAHHYWDSGSAPKLVDGLVELKP
jgi:outer membrane protein assembly factor BamB